MKTIIEKVLYELLQLCLDRVMDVENKELGSLVHYRIEQAMHLLEFQE